LREATIMTLEKKIIPLCKEYGGTNLELNISDLQKICSPENIEITLHAAKRLEQRKISISDVISCIMNGEIIEQYPDDYPYPSCLILGHSVKDLALHVVTGSNLETIWIVTAYFPDSNNWESDFKTRKEN
jgi:hypothetical protein